MTAAARYWHPHCTRCGQPKTKETSHCPTRTCPWCHRCGRDNR